MNDTSGCFSEILRLHISLSAHTDPCEKGSSVEEKNLLPKGVNASLLEKTPLLKGGNVGLTHYLP